MMMIRQKAKGKRDKGIRGTIPFALLLLPFVLLLSACHKSPIERTQDASNGGPTGRFGVAPAFVIFSSELKTGGSAFEFPGGNNQTLAFNDTSNPLSARSIRYFWNGQAPSATSATPPTFAGFDLIHVVDNTPTLSVYNSTPGRDLRAAGYSKLTFYARGSLSTDTVLEIQAVGGTPQPCLVLSTNGITDVASPGTPCGFTAQLVSGWQQYSIPVTSANMAAVKDLFKATFIFNNPPGNLSPGQGGTAYFDQIQYQP